MAWQGLAGVFMGVRLLRKQTPSPTSAEKQGRGAVLFFSGALSKSAKFVYALNNKLPKPLRTQTPAGADEQKKRKKVPLGHQPTKK